MKTRIAGLQLAAAALFLLGSCKQILGLHDRVESVDAATVAVGQCGKVEQTSASCAACVDQSCCNEAQACANDPACQETSQCLAACGDAACRARCTTFYSPSDALTALSACRVKSCAPECQSLCGEFASKSADCQSCRERSCCSEGAACSENPDCAALDNCRAQCFGAAPCISKCGALLPGGNSDFNAWHACTNSACTSVCQSGNNWSCLDSPTTWPTPNVTDMLTISLTLVNFTAGEPFVGAQVRPCSKLDLTCKSPLGSSATTDATGLVSLMVPAGSAGFDGYLEVTSPASVERNAIFPTIFYLVPNAISDGWKGRFQLLAADELAGFGMATGTTADPTRGHIALRAADCDLNAASRVSVSCNRADSETVSFYLVNDYPSTTATSTDASGVAAFTNLPTAAPASLAVVTGTSGAAANKSVGSFSVIVRPGTITSFYFPAQP